MFAIVVVGAPLIPWIWHVSSVDEMIRMEKASLTQYKIDHPESVSRNDKISCFSCNGDRIIVRKLREQTYMQEHVFTQCGNTLY